MTDGLLFDPNTYDPQQFDEETRRLLRATIDWFEGQGKKRILDADLAAQWPADFVDFVKREKLFATFLTPSEFAILATLMAAPGQVFSRLDLLDRVSGEAYEGYERTIDVHIRNLRTKIEPDPRNPQYVDTVYGMGYRFAMQKKPGA